MFIIDRLAHKDPVVIQNFFAHPKDRAETTAHNPLLGVGQAPPAGLFG